MVSSVTILTDSKPEVSTKAHDDEDDESDEAEPLDDEYEFKEGKDNAEYRAA